MKTFHKNRISILVHLLDRGFHILATYNLLCYNLADVMLVYFIINAEELIKLLKL